MVRKSRKRRRRKKCRRIMSEKCFLGIDTSNYTTSMAFCTEDGRVIANLKYPLPVKEGERGLRQSDAVFLHTKNLPVLYESAREMFEKDQLLAVGVSAYPRTQEGSYMPCFLAGVASAKALSVALDIPCFSFSHQNGHIMAAVYSSGASELLLGREFLAFHVSGGTTEVLLVHPHGADFRCEVVGGTVDIHAGQAIDRVGVAMGLRFPCGAELEQLALRYSGKIPRHRICVKNGFCNLSGVENIALEMLRNGASHEETAAFVLDFIGRTLVEMTTFVRQRYPGLPIVYGGGVMSCGLLKARLEGENVWFAEPSFSSDNAAGISCLARLVFRNL